MTDPRYEIALTCRRFNNNCFLYQCMNWTDLLAVITDAGSAGFGVPQDGSVKFVVYRKPTHTSTAWPVFKFRLTPSIAPEARSKPYPVWQERKHHHRSDWQRGRGEDDRWGIAEMWLSTMDVQKGERTDSHETEEEEWHQEKGLFI